MDLISKDSFLLFFFLSPIKIINLFSNIITQVLFNSQTKSVSLQKKKNNDEPLDDIQNICSLYSVFL